MLQLKYIYNNKLGVLMKVGICLNDHNIHINKIFEGNLMLFNACNKSKALVNHALEYSQQHLGIFFGSTAKTVENNLSDFVKKTTALKKTFTNCEKTKALLEDLILQRYSAYQEFKLFYDVPRLRVIPNHNIIKAGISYNYQPHRDTWYGAGMGQINHWIAVKNVSLDATFYIAPSYFNKNLENSSNNFDLETWDKVHRPAASKSINEENRPHPAPFEAIEDDSKILIDLEPACEIAFSGAHLHGSSPNTTEKIRLSIDYRVYLPELEKYEPKNVDSSASGNYLKYTLQHPKFSIK